MKRLLPNGVGMEREYDPAGRVTMIKTTGSGDESIGSVAYVYNAAGERVFEVNERGEITGYRYDGAGRIEEVYYPLYSKKKLEDFRERVHVGLYPEYEGRTGERGVRLVGVEVPGLDVEGLSGELLEILRMKEEMYTLFTGEVTEELGMWKVEPGEGAQVFGKRLEVDEETKGILGEGFEKIKGYPYEVEFDQWIWTEKFRYDGNWNRVTKSNGWGEIEYRYNAGQQMVGAGKREYRYDRNGNLVGERLGEIEAEYRYDGENRVIDIYAEHGELIGLSGVDRGGVRYGYDVFGRRGERVEYVKENGVVLKEESNRIYLYEGLGIEVVAEFMENEVTGGSGSSSYKQRYSPVAEYGGVNGGVVSRGDFSVTAYWSEVRPPRVRKREYYCEDVLGSTLVITDGRRGTVVERYSYDAFGGAYEGHFRDKNQIGYNGKRYDNGVGVYNYGYREYMPWMGRFTSVDPIRDGINHYVYCYNDPINLIDFLGLWTPTGKGTAIAEPGDTLWGLAELITKDGTKWKKLGGYPDDPRGMPVGTEVDYTGLIPQDSPYTFTIKVVSPSPENYFAATIEYSIKIKEYRPFVGHVWFTLSYGTTSKSYGYSLQPAHYLDALKGKDVPAEVVTTDDEEGSWLNREEVYITFPITEAMYETIEWKAESEKRSPGLYNYTNGALSGTYGEQCAGWTTRMALEGFVPIGTKLDVFDPQDWQEWDLSEIQAAVALPKGQSLLPGEIYDIIKENLDKYTRARLHEPYPAEYWIKVDTATGGTCRRTR